MTGRVVFDETVKELCSTDNECEAPEVCCLFHEEDSGVCHTSDMCSMITQITQNEEKGITQIYRAGKYEDFFSFQIFAGMLMLALVFFAIYQYLNSSKMPKKKSI